MSAICSICTRLKPRVSIQQDSKSKGYSMSHPKLIQSDMDYDANRFVVPSVQSVDYFGTSRTRHQSFAEALRVLLTDSFPVMITRMYTLHLPPLLAIRLRSMNYLQIS